MDDASGFDVRAYSADNGNSITYLCEDCADLKIENGEDLMQIEEYEFEDTFKFVWMYSCVECGIDQRRQAWMEH